MLKSFIKDRSGNFGLMGAGVILTLIGGIGLSVDYMAMADTSSRLQSAADAALLAAASSGETDVVKLEQIANESLSSLMLQGESAIARYSHTQDRIVIKAEMAYQPRIMNILGFGTQMISVEAAIPSGGVGVLDIALVLDVTESMRGAKLDQMKVAVNNFITEFENSGGDIRVSVIPFSQYVNVGTQHRNQPWIDNSEEGINFPPVTHTRYFGATCSGGIVQTTCTSTFDGVSSTNTCQQCPGGWVGGMSQDEIVSPDRIWDGCVGSRPGNKSREAFYGGSPFPAVYDDGYKGHPYGSRDYSCPDEILTLTDDYTAIRNKVNVLNATGTTYMPSGLAWGWRTLDGEVPLGVAGTGGDRKKALILMTDGFNTVSRLGSDKYHFGKNADDPNVTRDANQEAEKICQNIASEDILIYTIAYDLPNGADADDTRVLLSECASTPDSFFNAAGGANLNQAFEAIGQDLAKIRLVN